MDRIYCIYNPNADNNRGEENAYDIAVLYPYGKIEFADIRKITDYNKFFESKDKTDTVIICGGDGTLNRFVNDIKDTKINCELLYCATGSGNDFLRDLEKTSEPVMLKKYITDLPTVTVNGEKRSFINGVGYGIDGYCCEEGERIRKKHPSKKINYTSIAIKGLLFHYKPKNAKVTVDGKEYFFRKVWICPTMVGRYYGGGMMPTPMQKREDRKNKASVLVFFGSGKLKTLMIFPSLFNGTHTKHTKNCTVLEGKHIKVEFDKPTPLQIDGEVIENVTSYEVEVACNKNISKVNETIWESK